MNSPNIFEIAMNCPIGLSHPLLAEKNAWIDALLEEHCRIEEDFFCGRRRRSESDISDYEEEVNNVISRNFKEELDFGEEIDFDLGKYIDDLLEDGVDDVSISENIDKMLGVANYNCEVIDLKEIEQKWSRYFELENHGNMLHMMESGLLVKQPLHTRCTCDYTKYETTDEWQSKISDLIK